MYINMPAVNVSLILAVSNTTLETFAVVSNGNGSNGNGDHADGADDGSAGRALYNKIFTYAVVGLFFMLFPLFTSLACLVRKCCINRKSFFVDWSRHCYIWMFCIVIILVLVDLVLAVPSDIVYMFLPSHLFIIVETLHSKEWCFLKYIVYFKDVDAYIKTLTTAQPRLFVRQGNDDGDDVQYGSWDDFSKIRKLPSTKKRAMATRLILKQKIKLDSKTVQNVQKLREEEEHEEYEEYFEKSSTCCNVGNTCCRNVYKQKISKEIPGFKKLVLVCHKESKPFWMHRLFFFAVTLLLLGWPYRWFFQYKAKLVKFKLVKKISMLTNVYSMPVTDI